ncbi:MAG: YlbL family protein [Nocardioidaceae bacterium]
MNRQSAATVSVFVALIALVAVIAFAPVPWVAMSPGPTVDVLGSFNKVPIISVTGHKTYPTSGQLRMVTVTITAPDHQINLPTAMKAWFDGTEGVYPRDVYYPPTVSAADAEQQSNVEMVSSQDTAVAAALTRLGYSLPLRSEVLAATPGGPSVGILKPHDIIVSTNGTKITNVSQVSKAIQKSGIGGVVHFTLRRNGRIIHRSVKTVASTTTTSQAVVGIEVGDGYDFPFQVDVQLPDQIGGPSAGLMFSLAIYDTLTPGKLVDGKVVAGTGTITESGKVGPIGGIQQKIVAAAQAGAKIFFVPPANCGEALGADVAPGAIQLVRAPTMKSALSSLRSWTADPSAALPSCGVQR